MIRENCLAKMSVLLEIHVGWKCRELNERLEKGETEMNRIAHPQLQVHAFQFLTVSLICIYNQAWQPGLSAHS